MAAVDASAAERLNKGGSGKSGGGGGTPTHVEQRFQEEESPRDPVSTGADVSVVIGVGNGQNDVAIDMKQKEVVIRGLDAVDKVEITAGTEQSSKETEETRESGGAPIRRVGFSPEVSERESSTRNILREVDSGEILQKREKKRRAVRDKRSRLLAAFLHRKSKGSGSDSDKSEKGQENKSKAMDREVDRPPQPAASNSHDHSRIVAAPAASQEGMASIQEKVSIGASYVPKPSHASSSSPSSPTERRPRSGSFQYIGSRRGWVDGA